MGLKQSPSELKGMRHTAGVILIVALQRLISRIQPIEIEADDVSFQVSFLLDVPLPEEMLPEIERQMVSIIRDQPLIESLETLASNAAEYFAKRSELALAEELRIEGQELIPIVRIGDCIFPCQTPHELDTSRIGAVKLLSLEYDAENGLTTIYGTAFPDKKELKQFLKRRERAQSSDHCTLGRTLQLLGQDGDQWFWLPRGALVRSQLIQWSRTEISKLGFTPVSYLSEEDPALAHAKIYRANAYSYSDLPVRYCELREVKQAQSRSCGLFQTNAFLTDALTVFCRVDETVEQMQILLNLIFNLLDLFGLAYEVRVSGKYKALHELLQSQCIEYRQVEASLPDQTTCEVFIEDALGRSWLGPRLSLHHTLSKQEDLQFQAADGQMRTPIQISASLFSSVERFTALLIEHFSGCLPLWLAPEQIRIIPISERHIDYCEQVRNTITDHQLRVGCDLRRETLSTKVFAAENSRIPYVLVVGDQEEREGCITVRDVRAGTVAHQVNLHEFLQQALQEAQTFATPHINTNH